MGAHGWQQEGRALTEAAVRHLRLQEAIAAFADRELPADERGAVEAHLRGCDTCRRELSIQQVLARALSRHPAPLASADLRRRIEWTSGLPAVNEDRSRRWMPDWASAAAAVLIVIGIFAATVARRDNSAIPMADIPVVRDALADCRRATARDFPRKADLPGVAEGMQFPVRALERPDLDLFSTWKTTLAGAPAVGLAYRWRGIVVVQYAVAGEIIREQPGVGDALATDGFYAGWQLGQGVIAVERQGGGTLLIADAPPEALRRLIL